MMKSDRWISALLSSLCLFLFGNQAVEAIKCWECRSDADPKCIDPFDNSTIPIIDCDVHSLPQYPGLKATMCRKTRQKVYGNWRFIRSCAFLGKPGEGTGDENFCTMKTGTYNVFVETCTCNSKDGCNGTPGTMKATSIFTLVSFLLIAVGIGASSLFIGVGSGIFWK